MSVHDAEPADIYVDSQGKLWRCVGVCREPTVIFEEVEGRTLAPPNMMGAQVLVGPPTPRAEPIIKDRKSGGVTGLMWDGWKRIFRNEPATSK